ncbi:carbohydrate ABC transporter permease [Microbacterium sp. p3-SID131]|uniref:carbohydrate ABC transporter permease n=1 Tax=Microbacterium sp. p3-SID131 TaxID=2916215 RepID=UPI0021A357FD|nr:carbohydrate ABC transporter permease [Microbacterium sp. p3-SID131]MCT1365754.1 carbohydrate ABC transporter permease [Microbacterium sp. p3-SID131]
MIALLIAGCIFTVGPFLAILILALSPEGAPSIPYSWPERLTLDNLARVLGTQNFTTWTMNSLIYSIVSVMVILLTASMAGYSFAKKRFPGRDAIMWSFLATLMVPVQVTLIPLFVLIASLDGVNTYWGLIVPTLANSQAVFLMRQFIQGLPDDLFEAARIDGAGEWTIFFRIVLPLMKPILATLGIFVFLWHWNDFLWPLVIAQTDAMRTLTVGLASMNAETVYRSSLMAAAVISVIPCLIIFAVLQRYLVNSVAMTGIKG